MPMAQGITSVTSSPTVQSTPSSVTSSGGSPWDESLPQAPEPEKPETPILGSLEPDKQTSAGAAPFNVPENIEEKVGQKVPAQQYIAPQNSGVGSMFEPNDGDAINTSPASSASMQPSTQSSNAGSMPQPAMQAPKEGVFKHLFSRKPKAVQAPAPMPIPSPEPAPVAVSTPTAPDFSSARAGGKSRPGPLHNQTLIAVLGVIALLVFIVGLTELGLISIGAEKIYGAIGVEKFWGGLPANPENAVIRSALTMQKHPSFKAKGEITMSVDTSIKSDITSPLFSLLQKNSHTALDENVAQPEKATKAAVFYASNDNSNSSSNDVYDLYSNSNADSSTDSTSDLSEEDLSAATDTSTDADPTEADSSVDSTTDISDSETSNISDFKGSVSIKTSSEGVSADIVPSESDSSAINLMLKNGDLLVRSDAIKFSSNATPNKWLSYNIDKIKDKTLQKDIFAVGADSGFSVKGKREANEKVGNVRCFRYKVDSLEIGNALAPIGITGDMVQNISGYIWIGISDKTIRKVDLKIITPVSSSVSSISVKLEFSEFDVDNKLSFPDESEIVEPVALTTAAATTTTTTAATLSDRDSKRKTDVGSVLDALKQYKADNGSYPVSKTLLKLNASGNIIEQALVPKYISALPSDPTDGWYYAYKSNEGKNCSISARLENASDPLGQTIGGVLLYLKYNDN